MITIIVLGLISLLLIGSNVYFLNKYQKLKTEVKSFKSIGTGRYGFYNYSSGSNYKAIVYVDELDRYTDGYSQIKIRKIEPTSYNSYKDDSITSATTYFISLKRTSEIEWLESEDHIKKLRKEKLENLSKI